MPDFRQNNGFATSATLPRHALQRARQFARRIICRMSARNVFGLRKSVSFNSVFPSRKLGWRRAFDPRWIRLSISAMLHRIRVIFGGAFSPLVMEMRTCGTTTAVVGSANRLTFRHTGSARYPSQFLGVAIDGNVAFARLDYYFIASPSTGDSIVHLDHPPRI